MDGLARASGAPVTFEITEGRLKGHYRMRGITAGVIGELEQFLLQSVRGIEDISRSISKVADPVVQSLLAKHLYEDIKLEEKSSRIPMDQILQYINSPQGFVHAVHLCLLPYRPTLTRDDAKEIIDLKGPEFMRQLRDQASGFDWRGNSTGSAPSTGTDPESQSRNTSPGEDFTASSPASTGGRLTR